MGLFGKIKNIFYDEEIVEVEVEVPSAETKKELNPRDVSPRIEEIRLPKREKTKIEESDSKPVSPVYSERDIFKTETSFKFPVIDEEEEEPIRTRTRNNILDLERNAPRREEKVSKPEIKIMERGIGYERPRTEKRNTPSNQATKERTFKPSPVISPVYGVLDKNYKKEEIIERQHHPVRHNPSDMNYDFVRRKAYGTLEEELESTLSKINSKTDEVMKTIKEVENLDTEANSKSIEDLLNEIEGNKELANVSIGEIEERIKDRMEEVESDTFVKELNEFKKKDKTNIEYTEDFYFIAKGVEKSKTIKTDEETENFDKTLEHDLFNLIDSMYEEREGE